MDSPFPSKPMTALPDPFTAWRAAGFAAVLLLSAVIPPPARAADPTVEVVLRGHRFDPVEVRVPANTKLQLIVDNQDDSPEEFESKSLRLEKVVKGKTRATLTVGPLKPGRYPFVGEYHEQTAQGTLVAE
jgi:hypothetical protein